jgi:serine O-acetyltransferase
MAISNTSLLSRMQWEVLSPGLGWTHLRLARILFFGRGERCCLAWLRLAQHFYSRGALRAARACTRRIEQRFGCYISLEAAIGPGLSMPHPTGIVIGAGVTIGARCVVYQQVTIGAARRGDWKLGLYPTIEDDVVCFAGAKIIGPIQVGARAQVGANAVVLRDVAADHLAVGVPAHVRLRDLANDGGGTQSPSDPGRTTSPAARE